MEIKCPFSWTGFSSLVALLRWKETGGCPEVGGPGAAPHTSLPLSLEIRP